jgi:hypothetical protein
MKKLHKWYYLACVYELNFIEARICGYIFKTLDFDLHIELDEMHTNYHLRMLNIAMMTAWCM